MRDVRRGGVCQLIRVGLRRRDDHRERPHLLGVTVVEKGRGIGKMNLRHLNRYIEHSGEMGGYPTKG